MKNKKRIISILLSITIIIFFPVMSISKDNKNYFLDNHKENDILLDDFTQICLTPGKNETMLNFSWYSKFSDGASRIKIYEKGGQEKLYQGKSVSIGNGFISNKITVENLKPNTTYFYSYEYDGQWSKYLEYKTKDFENYSFIFLADPQIGASSKNINLYEEGIKRDIDSWNKVLEKSLNKSYNPSFIVCGGDETNTREGDYNTIKSYISNLEYSGFLSPNCLRNIPIANAIGNHDKDNENFYNHFNMPNLTNLGKNIAGSNYYFTYGDVLYLFINTNNLNMYEHEKFVNETVKKNKNIKWKIAVFHHDIYGGGRHKGDKDIKLLRNSLPNILENNNIDLVLCGHDHIYSRTYPIKNKKIINSKEGQIINSKDNVELIKDSKGIIYITGSSSTGSKFYSETKNKSNYIKKIYCEKIPTYTVVKVRKELIEIVTYEINNNKPIDSKIIIQK